MVKRPPSGSASHPATDAGATLGARLRGLRQAKGFSMSQLSARSGVPASTVSKIENGQLNPSLVHAINLASALDANLGFLVDQSRTADARYAVVRANQRVEKRFPEIDMTLADLNVGFVPGLLEARLGRIEVAAQSGRDFMSHPGEELVHVLEGAIAYDIDGERLELGTGDSLHFKCQTPHRWWNTADGRTSVLWVFSDGLSF